MHQSRIIHKAVALLKTRSVIDDIVDHGVIGSGLGVYRKEVTDGEHNK